jgi:hypothetical protein
MKDAIIHALVKTPVWIFISLLSLITLLDIGNVRVLFVTLFLLTLATLLYFMLFYGVIRKGKIFDHKFRSIVHSAHQVKVVVVEELLWRYLPYKLLIAIGFSENALVIALILAFAFTASHFIGKQTIHVFAFVELFAFFCITFAVFIFFAPNVLVLFIPHFLRNVIIQEMRHSRK